MIYKRWREDHEKSAFPSVYRFMFPDKNDSTDGNDAGHAIVLDGPSTMGSNSEIKDPVAVNLQTKDGAKTTTFTHQEEKENGIIPASCRGANRFKGNR